MVNEFKINVQDISDAIQFEMEKASFIIAGLLDELSSAENERMFALLDIVDDILIKANNKAVELERLCLDNK